MSLLEGQTLGDYEIMEKLGAGGMGAVYKARQISLNRFIALKVLPSYFAIDDDFTMRFKHEAMAAAALNHPNIVQVYAAGKSGDIHYFAMEYVEGESLLTRLERKGRIDADEAVAIAIYVAQALDYAWKRAMIIHRDVKPDNIFLSTDGEVKLGDLGLAKALGQTTNVTTTGTSLGTPHYASPEQARGDRDIDFRADIYSLGCTLFHSVTGTTMYEADNAMGVMMKQVNEPTPDIAQVWPECPKPFAKLVGKMLAKNRDERHQSYKELLAELMHLHEQGLLETAKPAAKSRAMTYFALCVAVIAATAGLALWSPWKKEIQSGNRPPHDSAPDSASWKNAINLLPHVDPQKDAVAGDWKKTASGLMSDMTVCSRVEIPYQPPEEYDFRITFTRLDADKRDGPMSWGDTSPLLVKDGKPFVLSMGGRGNAWFGFGLVGGKRFTANPTGVETTECLQFQKRYTALVAVRKDSVKAYLDGKLISEWKPEFGELSEIPEFLLNDKQHLGLASHNVQTVFHSAEVLEITGKGQLTRR